MEYVDEDLVPLAAEPDPETGGSVARSVAVVHSWVVDEPARVVEEVVAYYPETGGGDVELVVEVPEQGHWETRMADGREPAFRGPLPPEEMSGLGEVPGTWDVEVWVPWTGEELAERARLAAEAEAAREAFEAREVWLASAPGEQAAQDDAICALYELCEAQRGVIESQDDAICAVYEMIGA